MLATTLKTNDLVPGLKLHIAYNDFLKSHWRKLLGNVPWETKGGHCGSIDYQFNIEQSPVRVAFRVFIKA